MHSQKNNERRRAGDFDFRILISVAFSGKKLPANVYVKNGLYNNSRHLGHILSAFTAKIQNLSKKQSRRKIPSQRRMKQFLQQKIGHSCGFLFINSIENLSDQQMFFPSVPARMVVFSSWNFCFLINFRLSQKENSHRIQSQTIFDVPKAVNADPSYTSLYAQKKRPLATKCISQIEKPGVDFIFIFFTAKNRKLFYLQFFFCWFADDSPRKLPKI